MDIIIIIALFLLPLLFLLLLLRRRCNTLILPPSPPSLPILGHLHHLFLSPLPHHTLTNLSTTLKTPILYLKLGQIPTYIVSTPKLAKQVLKVNDPALASRPQLTSAEYLSFGCSDVTFSRYGAYWRQARRICVSELLSARRVSEFGKVRGEEVGRMLEMVEKDSKEGVVDFSRRVFELANNVLCRVAFGRRFEMEDGSGRKNRLPEVFEETEALFSGFDVSEFYPSLGWINVLTGWKKRLERNVADLREVCDTIIKEHLQKKNNNDKNEEREDFVDVLLRVQKNANLEVPITDDNLKALVLDMFVAGTDTTSTTLEWVMTELARHPKVMNKAKEEVRNIVRKAGTDVVTEDHIVEFRYIKAVIKETLRLHPPLPLLVPRESIEECVIDGYTIPPKSRILVNTYAMGRDPNTWENPLQYRPERFEGVDIDIKGQGQDYELLPFGGGRRGCPGYSFALATIELALGRLLYHFDWELPSGVGPDDVDLEEVFGLATRKKTPLILVANKAT